MHRKSYLDLRSIKCFQLSVHHRKIDPKDKEEKCPCKVNLTGFTKTKGATSSFQTHFLNSRVNRFINVNVSLKYIMVC